MLRRARKVQRRIEFENFLGSQIKALAVENISVHSSDWYTFKRRFLEKYFPPSKTNAIRKDISGRWNSNQQPQYRQPYTTNQPQNPQTQHYQPPHNRQPYHSNNSFMPSYEDILRAFQQENKEMREAQKRTEGQLTNLTELLTKFANQATTNPTPPPNPSPLPSQPLPNPKGGINMVQKRSEEVENKKARIE
ncbi:hypothetical protein PIB30_048130 [Stylosanthes scabra]|uniref:Uncharacterized protein n=1 Tax=Stylosanthes scabra TaxID=79078 RepID=A0ABU6TJS5_9FABA|nr:hypothetical protein [Stylosanthes scabra]